MAKKSSIIKQQKRERLVALGAQRRSELRERARNLRISEEEREAARVALNKMKRDTSPSRLKNRCQLTGRSRGFLRKFCLSRICFRLMANMGEIPGVTKASW
ncbi:30S ribosomal protein S14 [Candidatus Clavichlamydia salmonicola]|uniref:30S ribosomal protein S14 n=1 Tax=Candidatus Clavichlamydia salmonicola TaxID=469812 RepID=UPI00189186EE|nr:30S ribosomal protein S14 [Candidatus Clavichlamydia salmonicola]